MGYRPDQNEHPSQVPLDRPCHSETLPVWGWNPRGLDPTLFIPGVWSNPGPRPVGFDVFLTGWDAHLTKNHIFSGPLREIFAITSQTWDFQLPKRSTEPIKVRWDGRYLFVAYQARDVVILKFPHPGSYRELAIHERQIGQRRGFRKRENI